MDKELQRLSNAYACLRKHDEAAAYPAFESLEEARRAVYQKARDILRLEMVLSMGKFRQPSPYDKATYQLAQRLNREERGLSSTKERSKAGAPGPKLLPVRFFRGYYSYDRGGDIVTNTSFKVLLAEAGLFLKKSDVKSVHELLIKHGSVALKVPKKRARQRLYYHQGYNGLLPRAIRDKEPKEMVISTLDKE